MTSTLISGSPELEASRPDLGSNEVAQRLLRSAAAKSYDPAVDLDWDEPIDPTKYGFSPEWSTLYGTRYWDELSEPQRIAVTRHEAASVMSMGIWFEMILQQMMLRDQFLGEYHTSEFQWSLTEIADECRHSIMFARASEKITGRSYYPPRYIQQLSKLLGHVAGGEWAYGSILVAEEILDVLQRGCMEDERVLPIVRGVNTIHVLEESRHMRFAREEMRDSLAGASAARKEASGDLIALVAFFIVRSLISPQAYQDAGLDPRRAVREAKKNTHFQAMMRSSCGHLIDFLDECGLLTPRAVTLYRRIHMV